MRLRRAGPSVELIDDPTAEQTAAFYAAAREAGFAFALDAVEPAPRGKRKRRSRRSSLLDVAEAAEKKTHFSVGVCADPARALRLPLTPELRALLEDAAVPKRVHDWKLALHVLGVGVALRGPMDDTMLLSYALNPTHATQSLADVAARHGQPAPSTLAAGAAADSRARSGVAAKRLKSPAWCASIARSICRWRRCCSAWSRPACASTKRAERAFETIRR